MLHPRWFEIPSPKKKKNVVINIAMPRQQQQQQQQFWNPSGTVSEQRFEICIHMRDSSFFSAHPTQHDARFWGYKPRRTSVCISFSMLPAILCLRVPPPYALCAIDITAISPPQPKAITAVKQICLDASTNSHTKIPIGRHLG